MRKVVVTGIGMINPIGRSTKECYQNLCDLKLGIRPLNEQLTEQTGVLFGGVIEGYEPLDFFSKKEIRSLDLVTQYGLIAADEACLDAKLEEVTDRTRIGVNVSSGIGGIQTIQTEMQKAEKKGYKKVSPLFIPKAITNIIAGNIAIKHQCYGICNALVTACASSTDAIGHAKMYIEQGLTDVMITGGSEASVSELGLAGFQNLTALSKATDVTKASTPFDVNRSGFVMGEGACVLILEELEHAKARGAHIYGQVAGYGATCDASHITAPDSSGVHAKRALINALDQAGVTTKDVKHINCHGTSTPLNDKGEVNFINQVFEDVPVTLTSTKGNTGHLLGAAGSTEAAFALLSINDSLITPTLNTLDIDPDCNADICIKEVRKLESKYAISLSLGFGGHNGALVLKRGSDVK